MNKLGDELIQSMNEALDFIDGKTEGARVHVPKAVDVRGIRRKTGLTQRKFAAQFGFSFQSVRNWEQGQRQPEGAARVLLTVIDRNPNAVIQALNGTS